jgi:outer membrane protein assembly factor BamA
MKVDPRRASVVLGAAFAACLGLGAGDARGEVKTFPVPSVATTRNDGNDAGLIAPTLITKPDGDLQYIVAPLLIRNSIVGMRGALNVFRYDPGGRELRFIASMSEKIERKLVLSYFDPALGNGRYSFFVGGTFFKNATSRFFGISQATQLGDETNYTAREGRANWRFGLYLNEVTQVAVGQRFREVGIQRGATDLPFSVDRFGSVDGISGGTILGHRASFFYDTRDSLVAPTDGTQITAFAELNQNLRSSTHPVFYRYGVEAKKLIPSESKRTILVIRADLQTTFGKEVPFFERSSLGGQNNLRGYGVDRFIDDHLISINIEQRIHLVRAHFLNVAAEFEVAPFVDVGKVFSTFRRRQLQDYEITPGIGFRAMVRPSVVGRVDYGYSKEGGATFAGLDFPF